MQIFFSSHFKGQLKSCKKKYPKICGDLLSELRIFQVEKSISIGKSIYKIRIASSDMNKGKSGGFRSYVYFYVRKDLLVPLCIYAKSEQESISLCELQIHFENIVPELLILLG